MTAPRTRQTSRRSSALVATVSWPRRSWFRGSASRRGASLLALMCLAVAAPSLFVVFALVYGAELLFAPAGDLTEYAHQVRFSVGALALALFGDTFPVAYEFARQSLLIGGATL